MTDETTTTPTKRFSSDVYEAAIEASKKDTRVGLHDWSISEITTGTWPSGDSYTKFLGVLLGEDGAKADLVLSELPSEEFMKTEFPNLEKKVKKAIGNQLNFRRQLEDLYGISDAENEIKEGMIFRVKTTSVSGSNGTGRFIRVERFRPKSEISHAGVSTAAVPF